MEREQKYLNPTFTNILQIPRQISPLLKNPRNPNSLSSLTRRICNDISWLGSNNLIQEGHGNLQILRNSELSVKHPFLKMDFLNPFNHHRKCKKLNLINFLEKKSILTSIEVHTLLRSAQNMGCPSH